MQNICQNVDCRYFQKSENILLRCKILPPPTSTSSSPSSDKKWCAHNLYSLPLPSTLLLDNLCKIIFIFLTGVYIRVKFDLLLPASVQQIYLVPICVPCFKLAKRRWIHDSLCSLCSTHFCNISDWTRISDGLERKRCSILPWSYWQPSMGLQIYVSQKGVINI